MDFEPARFRLSSGGWHQRSHFDSLTVHVREFFGAVARTSDRLGRGLQQSWWSYGQGLALLALVPAFALAAGLIAIPTAASLLLVAIFGHETRGRDLRELEGEQLRPVKIANTVL